MWSHGILSRMPVMCYHSVDPDWESPLAVRPDDFRSQCVQLQRRRRILPISQLVQLPAATRRWGPKAVALTFDDGFAALHEHALPTLTRLGIPWSVFVVARTLQGGPQRADWLREEGDQRPLTLSAEQIVDMHDQGVEVGSHSWSHHDLTRLTEAECVRDLRDSREALEDLLHRPVTMLAYPYGLHTEHVRRAAEAAGYAYALSLPEEGETTGPFALPRVGVYRGNGLATLAAKSSRWYLPVRTSRAWSWARRFRPRQGPARGA